MNTPFPGNERDYEVGYGKPPKHTRFSKGQSGNPHGRPKKKKTRKELLDDAWQTEVIVNGRKMTKAELFLNQLVNDGIKGQASARGLLMPHLPDAEDELEEFEPTLDDRIEQIKTTRRLQRRLEEEEEDGS